MSSNDERLRQAYRAAVLDRGPRAGGESHPEPEALVAVAERSGSEAVRLDVLDHVMACDACRRELELVRASLLAAGMPRQRTWFRSPAIGMMAIAATLLVVAGVRLFMTSSSQATSVAAATTTAISLRTSSTRPCTTPSSSLT